MSESVDVYGMFHALAQLAEAENPHVAARRVAMSQEMLSMAMGYVWGIEDAGTPAVTSAYGRDVIACWEFAYMYAIVDLMYRMERIYSRPSIRDGYRAFLAGIDLREYVPVR